MLTDTRVCMQQLYNVICSPASDRRKKRLSQVVGAGGQRAKDQRRENAVLTGKETALFVFFVLRLKHLHRIFFFPSNLEIILIYFKPSIKTSHAAVPGWQWEAVCARERVCVFPRVLPAFFS